jgi:EAL domain-containing protein (putative c-di-GMP-specific phosphodiesterase class I)
MASSSEHTLKQAANILALNQGFTIELDANLLLQIMSSYDLKASDVIGDYSCNLRLYDQLIKTPPFNQGVVFLDNASQIISHWPEKLSWLQLNQQINNFLLAWLKDYKLGAKLDVAFLLVRSLDINSTKKPFFHSLLIHLLARVTNQFDLYKASYVQHFNLESGLPNQELLMQFLKQRFNTLDGITTPNPENLGLILINLNVNFDEASQLISASSHLMSAATQTIQQHLSDDATLFNISATELAIIIDPLSSPTQISLIVSTLIHAFEFALPMENITLIIKPYFSGISTFNVQTNAISMYEHAKLALHHAIIKNERVKIYDKYISSSSMNSHLLDEAIIEAFQQNELAVYLQPIVSIADEVCNSSEILLRWPSQEWQFISPVRLVETIYKKGFGKVFIRWLINNVCQRCAELMNVYQRNITLTLNLSATDLLDEDLAELLTQSIALWGISAGNLVIEITENDILVDEVKVAQVIDKIVLLGCKLALDDFGTGYSSMARLRNMPINLVKIDQSFVKNIATSPQDKAIVLSIVKLAHSLGKEVVAEGAEDLACVNILKEMKCEKIQGYYYAKPMSFDEFVSWLSLFDGNRQV